MISPSGRDSFSTSAPHARKRILIPFAGLALIVGGCAADGNSGAWSGPDAPVGVSYEPWSFRGAPARIIRTPHYLIHTTLGDDEFLHRLAQTMEGALGQYRLIAPDVPPTDRPMECYVFANRSEWAEFTAQKTGADSAVYLQINRGGYTVRDWSVAYYIGDVGTYAVSAHEGWHQFVARHFKTRLPPFLEEGLATMFENIRWSGDLPRWNVRVNGSREVRLRDAAQDGKLLPLATLVTMHAGDVVGQSGDQIEAFYAQNWAFAKFLWDGDGGRYRPALQKLLADSATGKIQPGIPAVLQARGGWNPKSVKPILERYLGISLAELDAAFRAHVGRS